MVRELFKEEKYMLKGVLLGVILGITGGLFSSVFLQILVLSDLSLSTWWWIFLISFLIFSTVIMATYAYLKTLEILDTEAQKIVKRIIDEKMPKILEETLKKAIEKKIREALIKEIRERIKESISVKDTKHT